MNQLHIYQILSKDSDNGDIQLTVYPEPRNITVGYAEGTHFGAPTHTVNLNQLLEAFHNKGNK
jgi:hypothetical protein